MELRSCDAIHFIQTVREGLVTKVCNTDSRGRPAIAYKSLKDVYENEDAIRLQRSAPGLVFDFVQVKLENPCFPVADRTLEEIKPKIDEFIQHAADDIDSELDDHITLKQFKKQSVTKKRKYNRSEENYSQDNEKEKRVEDDLYEPLINWKLKRSKTLKAKRKSMNSIALSSSDNDFTIKSEENLFSEEGSSQVAAEFDPVIHIKIEVQDHEQLECQNKTSYADDSSMGHNEGLNPCRLASDKYHKMAQHKHGELLSRAPEYLKCVTNGISYDHLEDVEHISVPSPDGADVKLETLKSDCKELLDLPPFVIENGKERREEYSCISSTSQNPNADICSHSRCSSIVKDTSEQTKSSEIHISDMTTEDIVGHIGFDRKCSYVLSEDKAEANFPCKQDGSPSAPDKNCGSWPGSFSSLQPRENVLCNEDTIADEEQPSAYSFNAIIKNDLNCGAHIEDDLLKDEDNKASASPITAAERQPPMSQRCDNSESLLTPEPHQPPERLLSTRKVTSPSSQERLCMEINSVKLCSDVDQYIDSICKGKLFEKQTGKGSDFQYDESTINHTRPEQASPQKVIISSRNLIKRLQNAKGNLEGPHSSRNLPKFNTECTSIQDCSESAIAFSQRQMHDMESLASKLMNELKSLKDIVEQKLLFEAYRNVSLKNDADGVRLAINNATKVEETARKWLSVMSRDCNRFCKIMKMTPVSSAASKDAVPRERERESERKKIIFADEAGGKLCQVKFFEDGDFSNADDVK